MRCRYESIFCLSFDFDGRIDRRLDGESVNSLNDTCSIRHEGWYTVQQMNFSHQLRLQAKSLHRQARLTPPPPDPGPQIYLIRTCCPFRNLSRSYTNSYESKHRRRRKVST